MTRISAYIRRDGDCREMMEFYQGCLGGQLSVTPIKDTPVAEDFPEPQRKRVMHATLTLDGFAIMGSDLPDPSGHQPGNDWALLLDCTGETQLKTLFDRLSKGGTIHSPPGPSFWGGTFALLTDRFDVDWMLNYAPASN